MSRQRFPWLAVALPLAASALLLRQGHAIADRDEIRVGTLLRTDTDGTQVIAPSARARVEVLDEQTHVDAEYTADVWTSASIDIRTAATMPVTEQRDEVNAGLDRRFDDFVVRGGYRFSIEPDYESHGGVITGSQDFADHNTTVEVRLTAQLDRVGRAGDELFDRELTLFGARLGYTQVIDPQMVVQGAYEIITMQGFQSSPYRFVGVGGDGMCGGTAQLCVPETHPNARTRHAIVVRARRAFDDAISVHADYRFYVDDWGLVGNTAALQLNWVHDEHGLLALRYRMHNQGAASFYRSTYPMPSGALQFVTRDRELSPLWTHRLALAYEREADLGDAGPTLRIAGALGGTYLEYQDFVGLTEVLALDLTLTIGVEL
ncbi:MAG: DUF3570 domain-containing protein [Myxococcota bacterium]|nr:DUF3570 domain-containing protein [Myxococcota bacterium]